MTLDLEVWSTGGLCLIELMSLLIEWKILQNGTTEEVKKIVGMLNEAEIPSEDAVGKYGNLV